jgi:8-amino-7-oxononanoate synthase
MGALDSFADELRRELDALEAEGRRRRMRPPRGIDLVSNDYLGLADDPRLIERMRAALAHVGAGAGGSRLLRGHHDYFEASEERLAAFSGSEAALLFSSGYAANLGLLTTIMGRDDLVLSDALNHASLIDGIRMSGARKHVFPHLDLAAVERVLRTPRPRRTFIVTESVFSMDGDLAPLGELAYLADAHGALLVVDEAHATGLYGGRGSGRVEELGLRQRVLATVHTGGKALGSGGAWISGSRLLCDMLVNRARSFIFSTAPLPVLTAALDAAIEIVQAEPARRIEVHRKAELLRAALRANGADCGASASPIVPVMVGANDAAVALQEGLLAAGFDARAIRPPTVPAGTARLRVTVRYPIADEDLSRFAGEAGRLLRSGATSRAPTP